MPQGEVAPEPWAGAMLAVGAVNPRTKKPSMAKLAAMSGVHATTVQRIVYGRAGGRGADADTIEKLAYALSKSPATVAKWVGQQWNGQGEYIPPKEANRLSPRSRRAVDEMIRTLAAAEARDVNELLAG